MKIKFHHGLLILLKLCQSKSQSCYLISEICGNNLSLIDNEFSKLKLNLNSNNEVGEEVILETLESIKNITFLSYKIITEKN